MRLEINTISKNIFSDEVLRVTIPTANGLISILDHHQPVTTIATKGEIEIQDQDKNIKKIAIKNAIVEIKPDNSVIISADLYLQN